MKKKPRDQINDLLSKSSICTFAKFVRPSVVYVRPTFQYSYIYLGWYFSENNANCVLGWLPNRELRWQVSIGLSHYHHHHFIHTYYDTTEPANHLGRATPASNFMPTRPKLPIQPERGCCQSWAGLAVQQSRHAV